MEKISKERDYFATDAGAQEVFRQISTILAMPKPYDRIGELPELIGKAKAAYSNLLDIKRDEVLNRYTYRDVHQLASEARDAAALLRQADDFFVGKREAAKEPLPSWN